jgi:hypothetical protein
VLTQAQLRAAIGLQSNDALPGTDEFRLVLDNLSVRSDQAMTATDGKLKLMYGSTVVAEVNMHWDGNPFDGLNLVDPVTGKEDVYVLKAFQIPLSDSAMFDNPLVNTELFGAEQTWRFSAAIMAERVGQIMNTSASETMFGTRSGDIFVLPSVESGVEDAQIDVFGGRGADRYEMRIQGQTDVDAAKQLDKIVINELGSRTGKEEDVVLFEGAKDGDHLEHALRDFNFSRVTVAGERDDGTLNIHYKQFRSADDLATADNENGALHAEGDLQIFNQYSLSQSQYRVEKIAVAAEMENPLEAAVKTYYLGVASDHASTSFGGDLITAKAGVDSVLVGSDNADEFLIDFSAVTSSGFVKDAQEVWLFDYNKDQDVITVNGIDRNQGSITQSFAGDKLTITQNLGSDSAKELHVYFGGFNGTSAEFDVLKNKISWS